jgi:hypothetical protein
LICAFFAVVPPLIRRGLRQAWAARRARQEYELLNQPTEPRLIRPLNDLDRPPTPDAGPTPTADPPPSLNNSAFELSEGHSMDSALRTVRPEPVSPNPDSRRAPERTQTPDRKAAARPSPGAGPIIIPPTALPLKRKELDTTDNSFPYPIAAAARTLTSATTLKYAYEAALDLAETLTVCIGSIVAVIARDLGVSTPALHFLAEAYVTRGVSQGNWRDVIADARGISGTQLAVVPGMQDGIRARKGGSGLPEQLAALVQERNRWAHGGRFPSQGDLGERLGATLQRLTTVLDQATFLAGSPWVYVEDNSFQRDTGQFRIRGRHVMGSHPTFDVLTFGSPEPLADEVLYLRTQTKSAALSPFIVVRECPTCRQNEIFHSDKLTKGNVVLKSFGTGHELYDPDLANELRTSMSSLHSDRRSDPPG